MVQARRECEMESPRVLVSSAASQNLYTSCGGPSVTLSAPSCASRLHVLFPLTRGFFLPLRGLPPPNVFVQSWRSIFNALQWFSLPLLQVLQNTPQPTENGGTLAQGVILMFDSPIDLHKGVETQLDNMALLLAIAGDTCAALLQQVKSVDMVRCCSW